MAKYLSFTSSLDTMCYLSLVDKDIVCIHALLNSDHHSSRGSTLSQTRSQLKTMSMGKRTVHDMQARDISIEQMHDPFYKISSQAHLCTLEAQPVCTSLVILSNLVYFAYRVKCIFNGQASATGLEIFVAWTFLCVEFALVGMWPQFIVSRRR